MTTYYKIGEFSKYLGVTPDFLKHYEQYGLIEPSFTESNYRYYSFEKSAEAIECIRFKNMGFSLKEMKHLIQSASLDEILESYHQKAEEMTKTIHYYQALIHEIQRFKEWSDYVQTENEWSITTLDEAVFLPHTMNRDFYKSTALYESLSQWTKWLPVVHSCQRIYDCFDETKQPYFHWGYSTPKKFADEINLPQGEPCELIPKRKCLILHNSLADKVNVLTLKDTIEKAKTILDKHNLIPAGEIHRIVYQYSHEDGKMTQHASIIIPLQQEKEAKTENSLP